MRCYYFFLNPICFVALARIHIQYTHIFYFIIFVYTRHKKLYWWKISVDLEVSTLYLLFHCDGADLYIGTYILCTYSCMYTYFSFFCISSSLNNVSFKFVWAHRLIWLIVMTACSNGFDLPMFEVLSFCSISSLWLFRIAEVILEIRNGFLFVRLSEEKTWRRKCLSFKQA